MILLILGLQPCCNNDIYFLTYLVLTTMLRRIVVFFHILGVVEVCHIVLGTCPKFVGFRFKFAFN